MARPAPQDILPEPPPLREALLRNALRLGLVAALVLVLHGLMGWAETQAETGRFGPAVPLVTGLVLVIYALVLAVPFMPGIGISVSLLLLRGAEIAPLVWAATAAGLALAFMVGRLIPYRRLAFWLNELHLRRAARLVLEAGALPTEARLDILRQRLPGRFGPLLLRTRYLALVALVNLPGNVVIGGGGGIAMLAGLSGLFRPWPALLALVVAALPIPGAVWLFGRGVLAGG